MLSQESFRAIITETKRWSPDHSHGYTINHLHSLLGDRFFDDFASWMELKKRAWAVSEENEPVFFSGDVNDYSFEMYIRATRSFIKTQSQTEIVA